MSIQVSDSIERILLSAADAARLLGVSPRTLWALTQEGDVPFVRVRNRVLYRAEALRDWASQRETREVGS